MRQLSREACSPYWLMPMRYFFVVWAGGIGRCFLFFGAAGGQSQDQGQRQGGGSSFLHSFHDEISNLYFIKFVAGAGERCSARHRLVSFFMFDAPFRVTKKALSQSGTRLLILRYHPSWRIAPARSAYFHTRRPDNGCGPRQRLLSRAAVRPALASPFAGTFSAAIPPSAAL